jgi:hypothetical protein
MGSANRLIQGSGDLSGLALAHPGVPRMTSTGHEGRDVALTPVGADVLPRQDGDLIDYESRLEIGVYFSEPRYKVKLFLWLGIRGESCPRLTDGVSTPCPSASPAAYTYCDQQSQSRN